MGIFARISNRVLFVINSILVLAFYWLALTLISTPKKRRCSPDLSCLSLFIVIGCFSFVVAFCKEKMGTFVGNSTCIGGGEISSFFAMNFFSSFHEKKEKEHIRIATWNVARFIEMVKNNNMGSQTRYKMLKQIGQVNADILCFQEFSSSVRPDWYNNIVAVGKGLNYPYHYFSHEKDGDSLFNGSVIFSRYPIVDTGMVRFPRPTLPETLVFTDIKMGKKMIRVYTTHLQSNQFRKEDLSKIQELKGIKGNVWGNARYILSKLSVAITHRSIQADMVRSIIGNSPHPVIFCGDLNDVPNSYTIKR